LDTTVGCEKGKVCEMEMKTDFSKILPTENVKISANGQETSVTRGNPTTSENQNPLIITKGIEI